jgi:hypothetical protein
MSLDSQIRLVIDDLKGKSLSLYSSRRLTRAQYEDFSRPRFVGAIARRLLQSGSCPSPDGALTVQLVYLKELDGSEFPFVIFLLKNDIDTIVPQALRAFVGHRFLPHITSPLRYKLASLLEPYQIGLSVADEDLMSGPVLDVIVRKLEEADFAIFDNRETGTKPNVYIELGIAYHMRKPFILFDH